MTANPIIVVLAVRYIKEGLKAAHVASSNVSKIGQKIIRFSRQEKKWKPRKRWPFVRTIIDFILPVSLPTILENNVWFLKYIIILVCIYWMGNFDSSTTWIFHHHISVPKSCLSGAFPANSQDEYRKAVRILSAPISSLQLVIKIWPERKTKWGLSQARFLHDTLIESASRFRSREHWICERKRKIAIGAIQLNTT